MKTKKKVALITGANSEIGKVTAINLAQLGFYIFIACRSKAKSINVVQEINSKVGFNSSEWLPLDLQSLASVKNCANLFIKTKRPLDLLINNAGLAGVSGITVDGYELGFGVNHLGHFLLTNLLLNVLHNTNGSRVITVSSNAHKHAKFIDWDLVIKKTTSLTGLNEYATSKLANILFSKELAKKLRGSNSSSYSLHPGVVSTNIWQTLPAFLQAIIKLNGMLTPQEGAKTTLYCALKAPMSDSGNYYSSEKIEYPSQTAQSEALAGELWQRSLEWTKKYL